MYSHFHYYMRKILPVKYFKACKGSYRTRYHEYSLTVSQLNGTNLLKRNISNYKSCKELCVERDFSCEVFYYDSTSDTCVVQLLGFHGPHINLTGMQLKKYTSICRGMYVSGHSGH